MACVILIGESSQTDKQKELHGSQLLKIEQVDVWGKTKCAMNFC